jgi:ribosome biogenesis protein BRX1
MKREFTGFIFKKVKKNFAVIYLKKNSCKKTRFFCEDLKKLIPNGKVILSSSIKESFFSNEKKKSILILLCNGKKKKNLYFFLRNVKGGSIFQFIINNLYSLKRSIFIGNAMKWSKPILTFDKNFLKIPHLRLLKPVLSRLVKSKVNDRNSEPYFDHMISFFYFNSKIWFRNYQINFFDKKKNLQKNPIQFIEIGPRFSLFLRKLWGKNLNEIIYDSKIIKNLNNPL